MTWSPADRGPSAPAGTVSIAFTRTQGTTWKPGALDAPNAPPMSRTAVAASVQGPSTAWPGRLAASSRVPRVGTTMDRAAIANLLGRWGPSGDRTSAVAAGLVGAAWVPPAAWPGAQRQPADVRIARLVGRVAAVLPCPGSACAPPRAGGSRFERPSSGCAPLLRRVLDQMKDRDSES